MRASDKDLAVVGTKLPGDLLDRSQCTSESHLAVSRVTSGRSNAPKSEANPPRRVQRAIGLGVSEYPLENRYNVAGGSVTRVLHRDLGEGHSPMDLDKEKAVGCRLVNDSGYLSDASAWVVPGAQALNFDLNPR